MDTPTPQPVPVGHAGNRELLAVIGNLRIEAQQHGRQLGALYDAVRAMNHDAPKFVGQSLLHEYRRHEQKTAENLAELALLFEG